MFLVSGSPKLLIDLRNRLTPVHCDMASLPPESHASRDKVLLAGCTSFEGEAALFFAFVSRFENLEIGGDLCFSAFLSSRGGVRLRSFLLAGGLPQVGGFPHSWSE